MKNGFKCSHKINMLCLLFFFCLSLSDSLYAENKKDNPVEPKITHEEINKLRDEVKEIRRDELNYKIEKDLLKETYSSNYQTINIIIALIMASITVIGTILGYIGFKGISNLKKEYENDLEKLRSIREGFESKLKELTAAQSELKGKLADVTSINEEQSRKIKILELKEKAGSYIQQKYYQRALDYIVIGIDVSPSDIELLSLKTLCLTKLRLFPESIDTCRKILSVDPNDNSTIKNLSELFLFEEQFDSYEDLIKTQRESFISDSDALMVYLESLKSYMRNDEINLKSVIDKFLQKQKFQSKKFFQWDFTDLYGALENKPNNSAKDILIKFTQYIQGSFDGMTLKQLLDNPTLLANS